MAVPLILNVTDRAREWMRDEEVTDHELNELLDGWTSQETTRVNGVPALVWSNRKVSAVVILGETNQGVPKTTVISVRRLQDADWGDEIDAYNRKGFGHE